MVIAVVTGHDRILMTKLTRAFLHFCNSPDLIYPDTELHEHLHRTLGAAPGHAHGSTASIPLPHFINNFALRNYQKITLIFLAVQFRHLFP